MLRVRSPSYRVFACRAATTDKVPRGAKTLCFFPQRFRAWRLCYTARQRVRIPAAIERRPQPLGREPVHPRTLTSMAARDWASEARRGFRSSGQALHRGYSKEPRRQKVDPRGHRKTQCRPAPRSAGPRSPATNRPHGVRRGNPAVCFCCHRSDRRTSSRLEPTDPRVPFSVQPRWRRAALRPI